MRLSNLPGYLLHPGKILPRLKTIQFKNSNRFLPKLSGIIHVGANRGQERALYEKYKLDVIWIEPIPEVFLELKANLEPYPKQHAYQYLITDSNTKQYKFNIANNGGASSSILEFALHKDIWTNTTYERTITLQSLTLSAFIEKESINLQKYDGLILDTQGSELLVLAGATDLLQNFKFIKIEVPDFESYKGCCQLNDVESFLQAHNFLEFSRVKFAERREGGSYYDIVYRRVNE